MSKNRIWSLRTIILVVLVPLLLCVVCVLVFNRHVTAMKTAHTMLYDTIRPGMTREQVYAEATKVGTYRVVNMEPRPAACSATNPEKLYVELLIVKPAGSLPRFGSEDRYLCFDASGVLIEVNDATF